MHILDATFPPGTEGAVAQAFVRAGARTPSTARLLAELGAFSTPGAATLVRRQLLREAVPGSGRFYLDAAHYDRRRRRERFAVAAGVIAVLALLATLLERTV